MPRPRNPVPKIRPHSSGQARVTIDGRDYLLGKYGSPEADEAYRRLLAQWLAREGPFAPAEGPVSIAEVLAGYWLFAEKYYGYDLDPRRGDCGNLKTTLGIVRALYATTEAKDFGPLDLRAVQGEMVRRGWCRTQVNHQVGRLKRVFKWAVAEEMIPAAVWQALMACPGLRKGKTDARESEPVGPVALDVIRETQKYMRAGPAALIDFALITGCRPGEACQLKPSAIDRTDPGCWIFRPGKHKTEHHGHNRLVLIGPKAQAVLAPFLDGCGDEDWVFSPRREEARRHAERRLKRKTRRTPSQEARGVAVRARPPKERYTTNALRRAIDRACRKAGVSVWGPNRLRHTRATELRPHGLDVVGTILGHETLETTQIYSEKDLAAAMALVAKVG